MLLNRDVVSFLPAYLYLLPEGLKQAVRPVSYAMPWVLFHDSMQPVSANPYYLPNVRCFTDLKGQCHEKVFQLRYKKDIYPTSGCIWECFLKTIHLNGPIITFVALST